MPIRTEPQDPSSSAVRQSIRLLALLALLAIGAAQPGGMAWAAEEKVTLNFVNAEIESVVKAVAEITGKTFVIDSRVKGTVNVVSSKPVPQSLAYSFLLSALRMQGFSAIENRGVVTIVPEVDAKTRGGPTSQGQGKPGDPSGDQIVTKVFTLRYESATQLVPILRPLIVPNNAISANANTNSLVISDYAENMTRLEKIIEALDTPYGEEPLVIPVRHASAIDLASTVNRLVGPASADPSQRVVVIADARTNSLVVSTDNPGKLARVRTLIQTLDQPTAVAGNIHVVYLKNAEALKVAQTLRSIVTGEAATVQSMQPLSANAPTPSLTAGATTGGSMQSAGIAATGGGSGMSSGAGFIQADPTNNALIITAPQAVYQNLRHVIDMLDKRRAQVFVEALIVELSSDRASEFGIQWQDFSGATRAGTQVIGGTNFGSGGRNIIGLVENVAKAGATGTLGLPPGLNLGIIAGKSGGAFPNLGALARLLETEAKANILSTPNLLTLDNEEARIVIGSNVPFITGQYAQSGNSATATPFQTYDRKDVGLTLKIRPQISEGGAVRLQIFQEASSIQPGTLSNASGPITNKRSIETAVVVDDGGIIVIGGLIEDSYGFGEDKVPLLGDIPVLGALFRYDTRKRTKTNLMVFLRPQIIRDASGYQSVTADRYDYIIEKQQQSAADARLMGGEAPVPVMPALKAPPTLPAPPPPGKQ